MCNPVCIIDSVYCVYLQGTLEECGFLDRYFYLSLNKKSPLQLISVGFCQISTCQLQYAADHQHSPMVNFTILHQHSPMFAANHNCALSVIGVLTVLGVFTLQWTLLYWKVFPISGCPCSPQCPLHSVQSVHHSVSAPIASGANLLWWPTGW